MKNNLMVESSTQPIKLAKQNKENLNSPQLKTYKNDIDDIVNISIVTNDFDCLMNIDDDEFDNWLNGTSNSDDNSDSWSAINSIDDLILDGGSISGKKEKHLEGYKPLNEFIENEYSTKRPIRFIDYQPLDHYYEMNLNGIDVIQAPFHELIKINDKMDLWVKYFKTIRTINMDVKPYIIISVLKSFLNIDEGKFEHLIQYLTSTKPFSSKEIFKDKRYLIFNDDLLTRDYGSKEQIKEFKDKKIFELNSILQIKKGNRSNDAVIEIVNQYPNIQIDDIIFKTGFNKSRIYEILKNNNIKLVKGFNKNEQKISKFINDIVYYKEINGYNSLDVNIISNKTGISIDVIYRFLKKHPEYRVTIDDFNRL